MNAKKLHQLVEKISSRRRFYLWERDSKNRHPQINLTKNQKKEIYSVFSDAPNTKLHAHSFYSDCTGLYSPNYVPDSLWYSYIDPFFNPRELGKATDSKILYQRLFPQGILHPKSIAYRINSFWIDDTFKPISTEHVIQKIHNYKRVFIQEAEESAGGKGVSFFNPTK